MTGGCQCRPTDPACGCGAVWPGAEDVGLTETLAEHEPVIGVFGRRGGIVGCSCLPARDYRAAGFCAGQEGYRAHLADALAARVAAERERADALGERIDALRDELAYAIRTRDEWEANADAAEAKIAAVEKLAASAPFSTPVISVADLRAALGGDAS